MIQPVIWIAFAALILTQAVWAKSGDWSCLCYKERYQGKVVDVTTCRSTIKACKKLQSRVSKGSRAIVKDSLAVPCAQVKGDHPSDTLGHKKSWLPSKKPGATWTPAGCFLSGKSAQSAGKVNELINAKDGHYSVVLNSGWKIRTYTEQTKGKSWLEATKSGSSPIRFKKIPAFSYCAELYVESAQIVKSSKDRILMGLHINCEFEGEDIRSAERFHSLISISSNNPPQFKMLWSSSGRKESNEVTGVMSVSAYKFKAKDGSIQVWDQSINCKEYPADFAFDGKEEPFKNGRCKQAQLVKKTIK